jgi:hypothetical protein
MKHSYNRKMKIITGENVNFPMTQELRFPYTRKNE